MDNVENITMVEELMTFYRRMIIVWTNKLYCLQYMRLNRLIETVRYTLPKVVLEGFLICASSGARF